MFTKSSFLVLLTVALSATSALAASDVGSKGAVSRRHHTPSKLSRSVAPSIKFSAKRSLRKKQEAKLARGLKAVNARGTNKLSRRGRITDDEEIGTGGNRQATDEEEEEDTFSKPTGNKDAFDDTEGKSGDLDNEALGDHDNTFDSTKSQTQVDEVDDKDYVPGDKSGKSPYDTDEVVPSGGFNDDKESNRTSNGTGDGFESEDDDDEEDLRQHKTTQFDDEKVSGSRDRGRESDGRVTTQDERITGDEDEDEDEERVKNDRITTQDDDRITTQDDEEDEESVGGKGSRVTRADDADFDKIARAEGIRRAPSGRWLGRRFK